MEARNREQELLRNLGDARSREEELQTKVAGLAKEIEVLHSYRDTEAEEVSQLKVPTRAWFSSRSRSLSVPDVASCRVLWKSTFMDWSCMAMVSVASQRQVQEERGNAGAQEETIHQLNKHVNSLEARLQEMEGTIGEERQAFTGAEGRRRTLEAELYSANQKIAELEKAAVSQSESTSAQVDRAACPFRGMHRGAKTMTGPAKSFVWITEEA